MCPADEPQGPIASRREQVRSHHVRQPPGLCAYVCAIPKRMKSCAAQGGANRAVVLNRMHVRHFPIAIVDHKQYGATHKFANLGSTWWAEGIRMLFMVDSACGGTRCLALGLFPFIALWGIAANSLAILHKNSG